MKIHKTGFTLVEIITVTSITLILLSVTVINLFPSQNKFNLDVYLNSLLTDIKQQQIKAMVGETEGRLDHDAYGIKFTNSQYILFHGPNYLPLSPDNFSINNESPIIFTDINLPNSQLIFASISGELTNFDSNLNNITLKNNNTNEQKTIYFNQYGVVTDIN